jgi:hypothetical protein
MSSFKKLKEWFNALTKRNKFIIVFFFVFLLALVSKNSGTDYNDGVGEITHNTANDWDKDATFRGIASDVLQFSSNHPDATKLVLIVIDECKDGKGNITNFESKIIFNQTELKEFAEYKDADSFNKNCTTFTYKILRDWHPCGGSNF